MSRVSRAAAGALALLGAKLAEAANRQGCPSLETSQYSAEPSPFGWPLSPNDFMFSDTGAWNEKYLFCTGEMQTPIDISVGSPFCPMQKMGEAGVLASAAKYMPAANQSSVGVSKYMRTAYVSGHFGSLSMQDSVGHVIGYDAVQVHLASPSLHTIAGKLYDAEMIIVHKPTGHDNAAKEALVASVLFSSGGESSVFSDMGFTSTGEAMGEIRYDPDMGASWPSPRFLDLSSGLGGALAGTSYHYNGSAPVPPCSETVKWIVMSNIQVSPVQIQKLQDTLICYAGGVEKRGPRSNPYLGKCRAIEMNSISVGGNHQQATCDMARKNGTAAHSAGCWDSDLSVRDFQHCARSPVDINSQQARQGDGLMPNISFKAVPEALVTPGVYSLDATAVNHGVAGELGDFGTIVVNGRGFMVRKISVKAISSHSWDGKIYPGELQIEATMNGDEFPGMENKSAQAASLANTAGTAKAVPYVPEGPDQHPTSGVHHFDHLHRVIISVPLALGDESPLLRQLGLPNEGFKAAIKDGHAYTVSNTVDLQSGVEQATSGPWFWYNGSMTQPGCPDWGVRWLVYKTPISVSLSQLNYLTLQVSGFDSTRLNVSHIPSQQLYTESLPKSAVDTHDTCDPLKAWNYSDVSCWAYAYPLCDSGDLQSPININRSSITNLGKDRFLDVTSWKPVSRLRVLNTGHSLQIENDQMGYVTLNGPDGFPEYYSIAQVHLRMPSEHFIDGKQYAAELQVVHFRQKYVAAIEGALEEEFPLVTSFLFDIGEESLLLKQLYLPQKMLEMNYFMETKQPLDLMRSLGPALAGDFYRYDGSLTTPGCHEHTKWFVFAKTMTFTRTQWATFKGMFPNPGNSRPLQPTNGRLLSRNSFEDGVPKKFDNYLGRHFARDRLHPNTLWILVPIGVALLLLAVVMVATFVREGRRKLDQAGGLTEMTIGKGTYNKM